MRMSRTLVSGGIVALMILCLVPGSAGADPDAPPDLPDPTALWEPLSDATAEARGGSPQVRPDEFRAYSLDRAGIGAQLAQAPAERSDAEPLVVSLPDPAGGLMPFEVFSTQLMESELAARHPGISTFAGRSVSNPRLTVRMDLTSLGLHASVRGPAGLGSWYIDPYYKGSQSVYVSYFGDDLTKNPHGMFVESEENRGPAQVRRLLGTAAPDVSRAGEEVRLRTYRLAFLTDPTYAAYFEGHVLAAKVALMNRVNQVYEDDLAIRMILINGTGKLNLNTRAEATGRNGPCGAEPCFLPNQLDPETGGCTGALLDRNRIAIGQLVGAGAYDIGHIGLGVNGGGIAALGSVGGDAKARGCTGLPFPVGDFYAVDYVAHEMGHQFSGNHTYNGTQGACGPVNRNAGTSVEPGSGSSVMAYAGICRQDNLSDHSDPYFSQRTISEVTAFVTADRAAVKEVQNVSLLGFDRDGDSFKLRYDANRNGQVDAGEESRPFVRGTTYNNVTLTAQLTRLTGSPVEVADFGGNDDAPVAGDTGFQVRFTSSTVNLPGLRVVPLTGGLTSRVGETARGGEPTNGGFRVRATGNHAPVVTSGGNHTIPVRTPFSLQGHATDADGDPLTYLWEQNDAGGPLGTALVDNRKTDGPLFAQFGVQNRVTDEQSLLYDSPGQNRAGTTPRRVFPDMRQILANNTNAKDGTCPQAPAPPGSGGGSNVPRKLIACYAEFLPTRAYLGGGSNPDAPAKLHFRLTARDLAPGAGGVGFAASTLTLDQTAGPFLVTSHSRRSTVNSGSTQAITWQVNGTDATGLAPNVSIRLSRNGGRTFPTVLAASTPNDGSHQVTIPGPGTDRARLRIEAVGNVFFDVNDAGFTISAPG